MLEGPMATHEGRRYVAWLEGTSGGTESCLASHSTSRGKELSLEPGPNEL